jgi:hypothetical protein
MTEQLDPQFEIFSEMLDDEENLTESSVSLMGADGQVLLELRRHLRCAEEAPDLPDDFSSVVAAAVERRYRELPAVTRGLVPLEPTLRVDPFSRKGFPWVFAVAVLGLGAASISTKVLGLLGCLGLVSALLLRGLCDRYLPGSFSLPDSSFGEGSEGLLNRLFYLIPVLAAAATAVLAGVGVRAMGDASLSFSVKNPNLAGLASALVVFVWLTNAFWPLWRAYEEASRGRGFRTLVVQGLHGVWMILAIAALWNVEASFSAPNWVDVAVLSGLLLIGLMALLLTRRRRSATAPRRIWPAIRTSLKGLMVGFVPIFAVFSLYYQASLTREIVVQPEYERMQAHGQAWFKKQQALGAEKNGLFPILYSKEPQSDAGKVAARLKGGAMLFDEASPFESERPDHPERLERAREEFLQELPRIRSAVDGPEFGHLIDGHWSMSTRVPNFLVCRGVSKGLEGLVQECLAADRLEQALDYQLLNLRWSSRFRSGGLIHMMVSIALDRIAVTSVERMLHEKTLSPKQLRELMAALDETRMDDYAFRDVMFVEAYGADNSFKKLAAGDPDVLSEVGEDALIKWAPLVPQSYWESERKIYHNLILRHVSSWENLANPDLKLDGLLEAMPWSVAAHGLVPNLARAQCQFMLSLSRRDALRTEVALELYRSEHGAYPERLEDLVPAYLPEVLKDAMHPNLKKMKEGFSYRREGDGYRLLSSSPLYKVVRMAEQQSYGPDGDYGDLMLEGPR